MLTNIFMPCILIIYNISYLFLPPSPFSLQFFPSSGFDPHEEFAMYAICNRLQSFEIRSYPQISSLKHGADRIVIQVPPKNTAKKDRLTIGIMNMVNFLPLRKIVHQVLCASFGYNFQFSFIVF
uniref:Uncharacterized protein n=1 Tax=Micrurus carvalhoi TaxID=3147026 RepID=A0A2H6N6J6_9SAUR